MMFRSDKARQEYAKDQQCPDVLRPSPHSGLLPQLLKAQSSLGLILPQESVYRRDYAFLEKMKAEEASQLRKELRTTDDPDRKAQIKAFLLRQVTHGGCRLSSTEDSDQY